MTRFDCFHPDHRRQGGFSLVEMALIMVIIGALIGGLILPLSTQQDTAKRRTATNQLQEIHNALVGFAARTGRLPCPATTSSAGLSAPNTATTSCTEYHGFVPAATLGLVGPTDSDNLLTDEWLNPYRYSLSDADGGSFSDSIDITAVPDFRLCTDSSCGTVIADGLVAVVFSQGSNLTSSNDQNENTDGDEDFVDRTLSEGSGSAFDDLWRWVSVNTLAYQLVRAGQVN